MRSLATPAVLLVTLIASASAGAAATAPLPHRSGSLVSLVRASRIMRRASVAYRPPSPAELALARRGFGHLVAGRLGQARAALSLIGFDLFVLHDRKRRYHVVRERPARRVGGWGLFVFDPAFQRPLVLEAPHARHDRGTGAQAARLMARLGGRALLLSTAYRCATPQASRCSGRTEACSPGNRRLQPYRLSDVAHTRRSIFQVAHEVLFGAERRTVFVQLHGFARRPGRRLHVIVSDGTRRLRAASWRSNRLAAELREELARRFRRGVASCNERPDVPLCGTDNVQGRMANGSSDPCLLDALRSSGRFLHVEQSARARRRRSRYFEALTLALGIVVKPAVAGPPAARPPRRSEAPDPNR